MNEPKAQEEEIFETARGIADAEDLRVYLDKACAGDAALRERLNRLLSADAEAGSFFKEGAVAFQESPSSPALAEDAGDWIGVYHLLEKIGEGGCGVVYMAEQAKPVRRRVALKIIKLGMDTREVVARFEAERQALAIMDHPNIAKVFDGGSTTTGRPFFVMELVQGTSITEYCDKVRLSMEERLRLFVQICQAIQHAHQKGIIHRDLKPSNILIRIDKGMPVPMVIDFGIAKAIQGRLTDSTLFTGFQQLLGTPAYMSPEQALLSNADVDTRSDIYSLGTLLYELLTGKTPFDTQELLSAGLDALRRTICEKEPARPSTCLEGMAPGELAASAAQRKSEAPKLVHLLRGDLDWVVMKCLEKDRKRRYATANALAMEVERFLNHEPVLARPPDILYRTRKAIRRNRLAFASGMIIAVSLITSIVVSSWQAAEARRARHAEREQRLAAERNLYIANMQLIQQAWEQNDLARVRTLLDETQDFPGRGFEWNYWQGQARSVLGTFRGHRGVVLGVAFSPLGDRVATASEDKTARTWSLADRRFNTLTGHSAAVTSVTFSSDGRWILTGSRDQTAKLWDAETGSEILTLNEHTAGVLGVALSADSLRAATASHDGTAKVWEVSTGSVLATFKGNRGPMMAIAFSPNGDRIVTGSWDNIGRVWDSRSGAQTLALKGHRQGIRAVAFSADGERVVTGSEDRTIKIWNAQTGEEVRTLLGHTDGIYSLAIQRDGTRIVSASWDQTARVWEASTGQEISVLRGHSAQVFGIALSVDGTKVVTGSVDGTAKVWDLDAIRRAKIPVSGAVMSVAYSPDGQKIAAGLDDHTARLWEARDIKPSWILRGHNSPIWHVQFTPDHLQLATAAGDPAIKFWSLKSGEQLRSFPERSGNIWRVVIFPDGKRFTTGNDDGANVWDIEKGQIEFSVTNHSATVDAVAVSPDGSRFVTGSWDKKARVWDATNGKELRTLSGHSGEVLFAAFSPDGRRIATAANDRTVIIWDASSGAVLLTLKGHAGGVWTVAFSPDGKRIVTGGDDLNVVLWDAEAGKEVSRFKGHSSRVTSAVFSPNGRRIVSGSHDRTVRIWDSPSDQTIMQWLKEEDDHAKTIERQNLEEQAEIDRERVVRAQDPGVIRQWLTLLPIPYRNQNGATALADEQIPHESHLEPVAGETIRVHDQSFTWKALQLDAEGVLNFNDLLGQLTTNAIAYCVAYVHSDTLRTNVLLRAGSDDQAKIYLNGRVIYESNLPRVLNVDQDAVARVELKKGINVLVFKVVNQTAGWMGSARITAADGKPLSGIRVTSEKASVSP